MTKDEQVVIDVLEHNAQQWDATDPLQAQSFRDAARVLTQLASGADLATAVGPQDTPAATPLSADPVLVPDLTVPPVSTPVSHDPADAPALPSTIHTPTDPAAETPAHG